MNIFHQKMIQILNFNSLGETMRMKSLSAWIFFDIFWFLAKDGEWGEWVAKQCEWGEWVAKHGEWWRM